MKSVCLCLLLLSALWAATFSYRGWATTAQILQRQEREIETMQTLTTKWTDTNGAVHEVSTPRGDGEEVTAWVARHQEAVDALQSVYPPA